MVSKSKIFCFHRVSDEISPAYPPLPKKVFRKTLEYIDKHYHVIDINDINSPIKSNKKLAVLTFDDAYYDFYENALPILRKHNFPAVQHVITHCAETGESFWTQKLNKIIEAYYFNKKKIEIPELNYSGIIPNAHEVGKLAFSLFLYLLDKPDKDSYIQNLMDTSGTEITYTKMMSWKDLNECKNFGIQIGSHTHNHVNLTQLDTAEAELELQHSRALIMQHVRDEDCLSIAFPNGQYNDAVLEASRKVGYVYLLGTDEAAFGGKLIPGALQRYSIYSPVWWKNYIKLSLL